MFTGSLRHRRIQGGRRVCTFPRFSVRKKGKLGKKKKEKRENYRGKKKKGRLYLVLIKFKTKFPQNV